MTATTKSTPARTALRVLARAGLVLTAGLIAGGLVAPMAANAAVLTTQSSTLFTLQNPAINESSGVAVAGGVYWTHNDNPEHRFYALDGKGRTLGTYNYPKSIPTQDVEDIAAGLDGLGRPSLYIGDIGANGKARSEINVIRVARPAVDTTKTGVTANATNIVRYRFAYPDGKSHDAESLLVQPGTNRIFIISKAYGGAVFAAPAKPSMTALNKLTKVGTVVIPGATAADFSPDGTKLVVRQYKNAAIYKITNRDVTAALKTTPVQFYMPSQMQGEAITFAADGKSLVLTSEGVGKPVLRQELPA